jgi:glycosyltransferase involved in cell wall biosynthesis
MDDLGIVIPAYNEESGLGPVLDDLKLYCQGAKILVVDDCSADNTAAIARSHGIEVITNQVNSNYGKSLKIGFDYLIKKYGVKYLAFLDADGTYPADKIPGLYSLCRDQGIAIAAGSRFGGMETGMPFIRKVGNKFFAWLLSKYSKKHITDTGTGLRVVKAELVPLFAGLSNGLNFTPAMTSMLAFEDTPYAEIPIQYGKRTGNSKLSSVKDGYRFLSSIMTNTKKHRRVLYYFTLGIPFEALKFFAGFTSLKEK